MKVRASLLNLNGNIHYLNAPAIAGPRDYFFGIGSANSESFEVALMAAGQKRTLRYSSHYGLYSARGVDKIGFRSEANLALFVLDCPSAATAAPFRYHAYPGHPPSVADWPQPSQFADYFFWVNDWSGWIAECKWANDRDPNKAKVFNPEGLEHNVYKFPHLSVGLAYYARGADVLRFVADPIDDHNPAGMSGIGITIEGFDGEYELEGFGENNENTVPPQV
ncbi:hypothetical protein KQ247_15880 [Ruegeria pomeroyi]|jgi:hypothetical protein|uniref:Uncharacterized protein n=2 Tax=Ruegeria pomeroyi TaxID=89184 RepID=V5UZ14_RUEPO|nr:hypothetical protein [Ruegeria pomeroyi]AHB86022.1 hypothetical protein SPO1412a [Ruegeria pomeroyi DSS-3]NVK95830.1 hypothetical protein [Ruegeria pomeroyi]NVL00191.1 hypothetical protein [Ruegeria pomeroyi]QWV08283.1 hypothetical protein KQ247_15880 [Ruegeria pomeroyi]